MNNNDLNDYSRLNSASPEVTVESVLGSQSLLKEYTEWDLEQFMQRMAELFN
jgi:hypothetical protein